MKTLAHNQQIKMDLLEFQYQPVVMIGTVEGYARENNEDPETAFQRCIENQKSSPYSGHVPAWTLKHGLALTSDYAGKEAAMEKERKAYAEAVELVDGEIVIIEGRFYAVRFVGDYSDPIHFVPEIASPATV